MSNTDHLLPVVPRPSRAAGWEPSAGSQTLRPSVIVQPTPTTPVEHQRAISQRLTGVQSERERLAAEAKRIEAEIASIKESLSMGRRRLPMAKMLVASPCDESWARMTGDDKTRFCKRCQKHVHNLSAMTTAEVEAFLEHHKTEGACVRLYERPDGTVLTADCPVGIKRRRARMLLISALGAGACALFAFTAMAVTLSALNTPPKIVEVPGPTVTVRVPPPPPVIMTEPGPTMPATEIGKGWLFIHAPEGTRIFEGTRPLGVGPLVVTLPAGKHTIRAEGTIANPTADVYITSGDRAEIRFHHAVRLMGKPPPPTTTIRDFATRPR